METSRAREPSTIIFQSELIFNGCLGKHWRTLVVGNDKELQFLITVTAIQVNKLRE